MTADVVPPELIKRARSVVSSTLTRAGLSSVAAIREVVDEDPESGWREVVIEVTLDVPKKERFALWSVIDDELEAEIERWPDDARQYRSEIGVWVRPPR